MFCWPLLLPAGVHWLDGSLHVARKDRHHDEWDRPVEPDDPYGPGLESFDDMTGDQER
jgi:hypothetical protein